MIDLNQPNKRRLTLDEIAHREMDPKLFTDKRTGDGMGYTRFYEHWFEPLRDQPIQLMEIGVNMGGSIIMWLEYFNQAHIYGVDIEDRHRPEESERYTFVKGDQQSVEFWQWLWRQLSPHNKWGFHIIIDDGGHTAGQIETSFRCLWPAVKPGGFYCIEDLGAAYNPDCQTPGLGNHLDFIKSFIDHINLSRKDYESIHMYRELAIIRKKA